ncbi:Negative regulator of differentiation 1 [Tolypocladium capitatum]|uniref:Negative regulator of differentiation 1 n=1 Tax=Tolypocladium capitatum TaxID=45235 RepID=A0A2K3QQU3_9HYPO|nr:Negative regulator of differentiation 1 [Tolypocladium capitatum]
MASLRLQVNVPRVRVPEVPWCSPSLADDPTAVRIARPEYDGLIEIAQKHANLCQNLINGGVGEETIQLLSSQVSAGPAPPAPAPQARDDPPAARVLVSRHPNTAARTAPGTEKPAAALQQGSIPPAASNLRRHIGHYCGDENTQAARVDASESLDEVPNTSEATNEAACAPDVTEPYCASAPARFEREATRSIQLLNLTDGTTHADITSTVRGGMLIEIYLRARDNSAVISFLHGVDAQAFYEHARQNGLYIKNQRVDVRWNNVQFTLPGHTAHKIGLGATRNLVIRRRNPTLTEQGLRDDMEHIHNLVVIKVEFIGDCCYISTNSVHNAVFARLCMMSRREYKGSRIEWAFDECAQPLDRMALPKRRSMVPTPANIKPMNPMANRFEVLKLED